VACSCRKRCLPQIHFLRDYSTVFLKGDELSDFRVQQEAIRKGSFDDLPPFAMTDINEACRNMTYLLAKENADSTNIQEAMISHTQDLIVKLDLLGKLARNADSLCSVR